MTERGSTYMYVKYV